jgi:LysR family transcriptional regulator, glycine cleavage system transcriptional activator
MLSPKLLPPRSRITARALLKVPLIPDPGWPEWFKIAGVPNASPRFFATRFPNYELEAQAAVNGVGAVLLSPVLYGELVAQKALLAPFASAVDSGDAYWLLWTKECADSHFVRWIKAQFSADSGRRG